IRSADLAASDEAAARFALGFLSALLRGSGHSPTSGAAAPQYDRSPDVSGTDYLTYFFERSRGPIRPSGLRSTVAEPPGTTSMQEVREALHLVRSRRCVCKADKA